MGPFEEQLFVNPYKRTLVTHDELGCSQLKGLGCPGLERIASFADSIGFRVWVFLPSVRNVGWFTTACLKIAEQRLFYIRVSFRMRGLYRDKSYNELVVIGTTARYRARSFPGF